MTEFVVGMPVAHADNNTIRDNLLNNPDYTKEEQELVEEIKNYYLSSKGKLSVKISQAIQGIFANVNKREGCDEKFCRESCT